MIRLSESTYDAIEAIELEANNKIIEAVAADLCQKRVTAPIGDDNIGRVVYLNKNGPYHIEAIVRYDYDAHEDEETIFVEVYDDNMENGTTVEFMGSI